MHITARITFIKIHYLLSALRLMMEVSMNMLLKILLEKLRSPSGSMLLVNQNSFMKTYGAWLVHVVERCTAVR